MDPRLRQLLPTDNTSSSHVHETSTSKTYTKRGGSCSLGTASHLPSPVSFAKKYQFQRTGRVQEPQPRLPWSTLITLVDLLSSSYAPIQTMIVPYVDIADVMALTRTCKGFGQLLPVLKTTARNMDHYLRHWFSSPQAFLSLQSKSGVILVGTAARHFLRQTDYNRGSLDLVVAETHSGEVLKVLEIGGYNRMEDRENNCKIGVVHAKVAANGQTMLAIIEHSARSLAAQTFDLCTMTAGAVITSWNKAYSLFPRESVIQNVSYTLRLTTDSLNIHLTQLRC